MSWLRYPCALLFLFASACGGGGGGAPPPPAFEVVIPQNDFSTIWVDGSTPAPNPGLALAVGDTSDPFTGRIVLRFRLDDLPAGAVVQQATLRAPRTRSYGNAASLGDLVVDHINWPTNLPYGPDFFSGHTLAGAFAVMFVPSFTQVGLPTNLAADVTTQLNADLLAGRNTAGFRLGFSVQHNTNGVTDVWVIGGQMVSGGPIHTSTLVVTYTVP
ncbi:MAG: hypothetical protein QNJ98_16045 [Planctomycetota bacterium]|nr:hypothetical protein [Planctomycetota bacterium]